MKKIITLSFVFMILSIILCSCFEKKDENISENKEVEIITEKETKEEPKAEKQTIYKEYTNTYNFDEILDLASIESGLTKENNISIEEAKRMYGLEEYEIIEILVRKDNNTNEIAIIRIPNSDETLNIMEKVSSRINEFNVNTSDNTLFVMEINEGILTIVKCNNAKNISDLITQSFKVEEE